MTILYYRLLKIAGNNTDINSNQIRIKTGDVDIYVTLYPQKLNPMILYEPTSKAYGKAPLGINRVQDGFRFDLWYQIEKHVKFVKKDTKQTSFEHYKIINESEIIRILGI